jgi:signal recognition particle receptor subunit beta
VVDSSDDKRLTECNDQLNALMTAEQLKNVPLIVFGNKSDLNGFSADEIIESLNLNSIIDRNWSLFSCSALKGEGIREGMEWLLETISNKK